MACDTVCTPKWVGGLGIPNLRWLNISMQARWPWLARSEESRPWTEFEIKVPDEAVHLFQVTAWTTLGDGASTLFGRTVGWVVHALRTLHQRSMRASHHESVRA